MRLARHFAGLVQGSARRSAGVLVDLARHDIDQRRTLGVAVPGYDATRLDLELADTHQVALQRNLLGRKSIWASTMSVTALAAAVEGLVASGASGRPTFAGEGGAGEADRGGEKR